MPAKSNPRRANGHRRNEARRRVLATEDHCGICFAPVDVTLPHGMPNSPEVDEIIPVSLGGSPYDRANLRLTHRLCNQRRGNKMPTSAPSPQPIVTSRNW